MSLQATLARPFAARGISRQIQTAIVSHTGVFCATAIFALGSIAASHVIGRPFSYAMAEPLSVLYCLMVPIFLGLLAVVAFVRMALVDKPASPSRHMMGLARSLFLDTQRLLDAAMLSVLVMAFMTCFAFMKDAIPALHSFSWDRTFAHMDRLLFFGADGWHITFALLGTPQATTVINAVYHAWLFVIYMFLLAAVFGLMDRRLKLTFLYAFFLTWGVGGVVLAIVFSSAGPVYFANLGLGQDFAGQMEALRRFNEVSPVWALSVQDQLWASYNGDDGMMRGISAMPSMHVGSSVVIMLAAYRMNRLFGHVMAAFVAVIFVGSVHLGWHYAVDGIFAAILAVALWRFAALVTRLDLDWQARVLSRD